MSTIFTCTHLLLLSISIIQEAVLCLLRFWAPQSVVPTTVPSHMSALVVWSRMTLVRGLCQLTQVWTKKSVVTHDFGVWGLANVFANGTFQADVPEANCLPQGLGPPVRPAAKPAPKAAKPLDKPSTKSAANSAAQRAAKPAAKSAAGEPIPVAPMGMCSSSESKMWHTEPVSQ